jgi:hypothetical protein
MEQPDRFESGQLHSGPYPSTPVSKHVRGWWGRNWLWAVPVGCLAFAILACGGGIAVLFVAVFGSLKSSEPYQEALRRAKADPRVQAALGVPIQERFFVSGNISVTVANGTETGKEEVYIPISGPQGTGTIQVVGSKVQGKWTYSKMTMIVSGKDEPIDLLSPVSVK